MGLNTLNEFIFLSDKLQVYGNNCALWGRSKFAAVPLIQSITKYPDNRHSMVAAVRSVVV